VGSREVLCGVDLALQSDVLVVGAESSCGHLEAVVRVRVVVVGVDAASVWLIGVVDDLSLIPAAGVLLGKKETRLEHVHNSFIL